VLLGNFELFSVFDLKPIVANAQSSKKHTKALPYLHNSFYYNGNQTHNIHDKYELFSYY